LIYRLQAVDFDLLGAPEGGTLLDVGCGRGFLLHRARRRVRGLVGLDLDLESLRVARTFLPPTPADPRDARASFFLGDGTRLPFADASLDAVICTETLEHIPDDARALSELARILKPRGKIAISVPDTLPEVIVWRLAPWTASLPGGHVRIYARRTIVRRIERAGLRPYLKRWRHSLEAIYWILLYLIDGSPCLRSWADRKLKDWQQRTNRKPYPLFYHFFDEVGNHFLPKSIVIYATKPRADEPPSA
jgi:ubiquinone/menaquinone biosynthesis C-methylase UbiE